VISELCPTVTNSQLLVMMLLSKPVYWIVALYNRCRYKW